MELQQFESNRVAMYKRTVWESSDYLGRVTGSRGTGTWPGAQVLREAAEQESQAETVRKPSPVLKGVFQLSPDCLLRLPTTPFSRRDLNREMLESWLAGEQEQGAWAEVNSRVCLSSGERGPRCRTSCGSAWRRSSGAAWRRWGSTASLGLRPTSRL